MSEALNQHILAVYGELEKRSVVDETFGDHQLVFTGNFTEVYNYFGISSSMYSRIRRVLVESGSIEVVQKGTGAQPSIILLHGAPSAENLSDEGLTSPRRLATMVGQMQERLAALEAWRESIPLNVTEALREHEVRIGQLEQGVSDGES